MGELTLALSGLTGGTTGTLDKIDGAGLSDGDAAVVVIDSGVYHYRLDATSGAAENSPYVISPDTNAGTKRWVLKNPVDNYTRIKAITSNTTIYVETTGNDTTGDGSAALPYATAQKALLHLRDYWIAGDVTVTIQIGDGQYPMTENITVTHPCGNNIKITGENTYSKSMTSIQSSSGAAGAWSLVLNLGDVANIAVGDFAIITAPSGGTLTYHVAGCHEVTAVDGANSRITVATTHQNTSAPSGAISASVEVIKTVLQMAAGEDGLYIAGKNGLGGLADLVFDGLGGTGYGIHITDFSFLRIIEASFVGVFDAALCVFSDNGSNIVAAGTLACSGANSSHSIMADDHATIVCPNAVASGMQASSKYGFFATYNSHIEATGAIATGGKSIGFLASIQATFRVVDAVADDCTTGYYSSRGAYMYASGATAVNCSTTFSPAVNTQGNEFGYIDT